MKRSQLTSLPVYFDRYINMTDDIELTAAIQASIDEIAHFPLDKWEALGNTVYEPGKWTVKDILQHLIDVERIFMYRVLAFARNEKQILPAFDEDSYAAAANAGNRTFKSLVDELRISHESLKMMYESFTSSMLEKTGKGFKGDYSVAAMGFMLPGHQRWHLKILEERYYPLLKLSDHKMGEHGRHG